MTLAHAKRQTTSVATAMMPYTIARLSQAKERNCIPTLAMMMKKLTIMSTF